jgi:hypothetical protein
MYSYSKAHQHREITTLHEVEFFCNFDDNIERKFCNFFLVVKGNIVLSSLMVKPKEEDKGNEASHNTLSLLVGKILNFNSIKIIKATKN